MALEGRIRFGKVRIKEKRTFSFNFRKTFIFFNTTNDILISTKKDSYYKETRKKTRWTPTLSKIPAKEYTK